MLLITFLLSILFHYGYFDVSININPLKNIYETNLNTSITLERDDRLLRDSWALEFQVKKINVSTTYRLQMMRHRDHVFQNSSHEWSECLFMHRRQIRKLTRDYNTAESECLISTAADKDRTRGVEQVEREIIKWRKGYRYLSNTCNTEHPEDKHAAKTCLVEYMEKDNYNSVIQRLIILKLEAMELLFVQLTSNLVDLEECLKTKLSIHLEKVRNIMYSLNKCYTLKTQE